MKKSKLLIPIFMGMSYRNFVLTGIVDALNEKYEVSFLVLDNSKIHQLFIDKNIPHVVFTFSLFRKLFYKLFSLIEKLQYFSFYQKHQTGTMRKYIINEKKKCCFGILYKLAEAIGFFFDQYSFISFHYTLLLSRNVKRKLNTFDKVFILSTDYLVDKAILKYCNQNMIKSSAIVHSWDNLPARGFLSATPDTLLVWNWSMKLQAEHLHGIESSSIKIVGVPQFNFYRRLEARISHDMFMEFYKVVNDKHVVTYTCSAERVFPDEESFIDELIKICQRCDAYLVLRLHPTERRSRYIDRFTDVPRVIIDVPDGNFAATVTDSVEDNELSMLRFVSLMKYSSVVINMASTTTLDAIIFDTPVICVAFNMDSKIDLQWNNSKDWYASTHYQDIIKSGAVRLSSGLVELENDIVDCLKYPELLQKERMGLADAFCLIHENVPANICQAI